MAVQARSSRLRTLSVAAVVVAAALSSGATTAAERFTAQAVNMSNIGPGGDVGVIDIIIDRYSTEAERTRFVAALTEGGNDGLLAAFQKAPSIGKIGPTGVVGLDVRYAHAMPGEDGGRQIIIASDRRMSFLEVANRPRTIDYPFTVVQLKVDKSGQGEGKASILTRIETDKRNNAIVLENFASQPVDLISVRQTAGSPQP